MNAPLLTAPGAFPFGEAMQWRADLLLLHALSDLAIAGSFLAIVTGIVWYMQRRFGIRRDYRLVTWMFSGFLLAAGLSHLIDAAAIWYPIHIVQGIASAVTASLAMATIVLLWPLLPELVRMPSVRVLGEQNRQLRREAQSHEAASRELEQSRRGLEARVEERTHELTLAKARFETALHGAKIYVFSQDQDLRYTWIYGVRDPAAVGEMLGRSDEELLAAPERDAIVALKRAVLASGESADREITTLLPRHRGLFAVHVDPSFNAEGAIDGITCAAIDISRIRALETEQRRLATELGDALQRYETALRGSNVTVYTQDRDLRFTSISNGMFGRPASEIEGRLEDEVMPPNGGAAVMAVKRRVIESGQPADSEFSVVNNDAKHWYDVHIEPLRDIESRIVGVTCAAVDITGRKVGEAHLRELMRELTHRSKNLLAVIQGMARQTARHSGSTESFLEQFSARLQALASSHDLLVQEGWHGASLSELVRSQLGHYIDRGRSQVAIQGPSLLLKPEAAQSLGLALHELATNAAKYGGLSVPAGRVSIDWKLLPAGEGDGIEIVWMESGGPTVEVPQHRGFGSMVIERNLARALDAEVRLEYPPDGARCRMVIPAANLAVGH
jgi:PAS domain S-box-containing protein